LKNVLEDFKITSYTNEISVSTLASKKLMECEDCSCHNTTEEK